MYILTIKIYIKHTHKHFAIENTVCVAEIQYNNELLTIQ